MPIAGLTNPPKSFLKLGQIRKGELREVNGKNGKYTAPVDLDYFRVTFRPDEKEVESEFRRVYGEKPTRINIRFPFKTIPEVWDANYEAYTKGGLIAKAATKEDGTAYWIFYRDYDTGEILVRNGSPVGAAGIEFMAKPLDVSAPVFTYKSNKGEITPVFMEPVGRLQVVVPEIAQIRVGYLEFRPGSTKDIGAISRELAAIDMLAQQAGKDISGIPMVLSRREEMMTKNINGKLSQSESWLVHIEVLGTWGKMALNLLERNSQPDTIEGEVLELPYDESWDGEMDLPAVPPAPPAPVALKERKERTPKKEKEQTPPEPETPPSEEPQSEPQSVPEQTPTPERPKIFPAIRPYSPLVMKENFAKLCTSLEEVYKKRNDELKMEPRERQVVAAILDTIMDGNKMHRYEFLEFLCGKQSTSDLTTYQIRGLEKIMGLTLTGSKDDFSLVPDKLAVIEIKSAHAYYVEELVKAGAR